MRDIDGIGDLSHGEMQLNVGSAGIVPAGVDHSIRVIYFIHEKVKLVMQESFRNDVKFDCCGKVGLLDIDFG